MAGRPKQGIDYAGWSVNIFDGDTKIDKLLDAQGWIGFSVYFYLCQMAYKFDGYFYRWSYDDSATTARRMSGGVSSKTVENTVGLCLQIGLFDKPLFDRHGILTSKGIQRRYLAAIQGRRVKSIIDDYWLLEKNRETGRLEKCASNDDSQNSNSHLQGADEHLQGANGTKVKESKVNTPPTPPTGGTGAKPKKPASRFALQEDAKILLRNYVGDDEELHKALGEFIRIRQDLRAINSKHGISNLLRELERLSGGDRTLKLQLIRQSCANSWKSVFPIRISGEDTKKSGSLPEPEVRNGVR